MPAAPRFLIRGFQVAALWLLASAGASSQPSMKPFYKHWEMVANSDLVARVRLHVPLSALRTSVAAKERYRYVHLKVDIEEPIKGHFPLGDVPIRYYTGGSEYYPSASFVEDNDGQEVITFLRLWAGGSDFPDEGPDALISFSGEAFSQIEAEVKNQAEIAQHFGELPVGRGTAEDAQIRRLFDGLTGKSTQEVAWGQLLKLSRRDVPAVVRLMNDHRRIPYFGAPLPNLAPDAFEKFRQYGAGSVHEAATHLLDHLTGNSFKDDGWRVWCAYNSGAI